jgi:hypothetical protein
MTRIRAMRQACWLEAFPPRAEACAPAAAAPGILCGPTGMALCDPKAAAHQPALILELYVAAARRAAPGLVALRAPAPPWPTPRAAPPSANCRAYSRHCGNLPRLRPATESSPPHARHRNRRKPARPGWPEPGALLAPRQTPRASRTRHLPNPRPGRGHGPAVHARTPASWRPWCRSCAMEHLVQFDDFHIHPWASTPWRWCAPSPPYARAGRRSGAARRTRPFARGPGAGGGLPHFDRLLLAGFCHDWPSPPRPLRRRRGACARGFGPPGGRCRGHRRCGFLVREHLPSPRPHPATSRTNPWPRPCRNLRRRGTLDMLHLLAVADSRSTGPRAWSPGRRALRRTGAQGPRTAHARAASGPTP